MRSFRGNIWLKLTLCIFCAFTIVPTVQADGLSRVATRLTISSLEPVVVGKRSTITVYLTDADGKRVGAVANEVLYLFIDGVQKRRIRTDRIGMATFAIKNDLSVGMHNIQIVYKGSSWLMPSEATAELEIVPAEVEIHTVPSLPNISFSLAGRIFTSDKTGIARIEVDQPGTYVLEILQPQVSNSNIRASFIRWGDNVFSPDRKVSVPRDKPLHVGFEVSHPVSQTFVDLLGQPVDPARITSLTLNGSNGATYTFKDNQPHWLPAGRVTRMKSGLKETKILYSLVSVTIDGSNVVNRAQQRFYVEPNDVWLVKLLLYEARFMGRDALFNFPIGTGIRLEYPDGRSREFPFDSERDLKVDALARGPYKATIVGAKGISPTMPLTLSRDQAVELLVISYLDITVVSILAISLALGLLFLGRPEVLRMLVMLSSSLFHQRRARRLQPTFTIQTINTSALGQCPLCWTTTRQAKAGLNRSGSQRYRCSVCSRVYTPKPNLIGFSTEIRERALQLYLAGNSRRSIARNLNVSPRTISKWIGNHKVKLSQPQVYEPAEVGDLDDRSASVT